jgi:hypothetical protein
MPPEAMTVCNSKLRSMTGSMTGCPHLLHGVVANGARSAGINDLDLQRPQVTIFRGLFAPLVPVLTSPA